MTLPDFTSEKNIIFLSTQNKFTAIEELARSFSASDVCDNIEQLIFTLKEREEMMSTGIGFGIAIPHAKIPQVKKLSFAVGISVDGIDFDSMDGYPVNLIILVAAKDKQSTEYLELQSKIMRMLKIDSLKDYIIAAKSPKEVYSIFEKNI